jgi:hypothetical protein
LRKSAYTLANIAPYGIASAMTPDIGENPSDTAINQAHISSCIDLKIANKALNKDIPKTLAKNPENNPPEANIPPIKPNIMANEIEHNAYDNVIKEARRLTFINSELNSREMISRSITSSIVAPPPCGVKSLQSTKARLKTKVAHKINDVIVLEPSEIFFRLIMLIALDI